MKKRTFVRKPQPTTVGIVRRSKDGVLRPVAKVGTPEQRERLKAIGFRLVP